ncbi:MAG: CHAD domain-containing protein [Verrucomicrobia bacterium]|nr:CHAD domain-containing protein [Verrucomicrobiota bacterium]
MAQANISLQRHETLRSGLLRVVDILINSIVDSLADLSPNDEEDIHRIRTSIKRLRALLRLVRPAVDPTFFDRENGRLRTAARLLSFARDAEVAQETLKTLPVSEKTDRDAVGLAASGFERQVGPPKDLDRTLAEVRKRVEQTRRNFHRLELRGTGREIVESGVRKVYRQGRSRMKVAIAQGQDSAFHSWRIRAKNLY